MQPSWMGQCLPLSPSFPTRKAGNLHRCRCALSFIQASSMPAHARRALVVSLHDVSPHTHTLCERIVGELEALGVRAVSLLVIPDHHHRMHFLEDAVFCEWLREQPAHGHEAVIHGYFHQRARRDGETPMAKAMTRIYTADEGEFYDIDRATALDLVSKGRGEFRSIGLDPRGFIAPAWLLGAEAVAALRELRIEYTTLLGSVLDFKRDATHQSQSLVWSVRSACRRGVSRLWNARLFRKLATNPLLRISIHPVDIEHPAIWRQIRTLVTRALVDRESLTYHAWVSRTPL